MSLDAFPEPVANVKRALTALGAEDTVTVFDSKVPTAAAAAAALGCDVAAITNSLVFLATLINDTEQILLATGTTNLSQQHPVLVAANSAMFDHLADGRFILGVSPGALPSDAEVLGILDQDRNEMFAEALQTRINSLSTDFVNRDDPFQRAKIGEDRDKAIAELARVKGEIVRAKKQIEDIEEEARKAGVPPGWLR